MHYDLMLEVGVLRTWSEPPVAGVELECRLLADHRLPYLDYEGPISGGRGTVTPWTAGHTKFSSKATASGRWPSRAGS